MRCEPHHSDLGTHQFLSELLTQVGVLFELQFDIFCDGQRRVERTKLKEYPPLSAQLLRLFIADIRHIIPQDRDLAGSRSQQHDHLFHQDRFA